MLRWPSRYGWRAAGCGNGAGGVGTTGIPPWWVGMPAQHHLSRPGMLCPNQSQDGGKAQGFVCAPPLAREELGLSGSSTFKSVKFYPGNGKFPYFGMSQLLCHTSMKPTSTPRLAGGGKDESLRVFHHRRAGGNHDLLAHSPSPGISHRCSWLENPWDCES